MPHGAQRSLYAGARDALTSIMKKPNQSNRIEMPTLYGTALFFDRCLNLAIEHDDKAVRSEGLNISLLGQLDRFVQAVLETELLPFRVRGEMHLKRIREWDANGQDRIVSRPTYAAASRRNPSFPDLGNLVVLLENIKGWPSSHPAANTLCLPPHLRLLFDVYFEHPISRNTKRELDAFADDTGRSVAEVCNDFVDRFRQTVRAKKGLRRELHNWYLGSQENVANLQAYLDDLFTLHTSLTVVHLRLLHAPPSAGYSHHVLQALRDCRTKLLDRMRKNPALFTAKPGYVWAILPSLDGRYDLHLTLFFDTAALHKLLDDKQVEAERAGTASKDHADLIGAYWVEEITKSQGCYFRADRELLLYGRDWVHGEISSSDVTARDKLRTALESLAMRRALVRLQGELPGPYFGMAEREPRGESQRRKVGRVGAANSLGAGAGTRGIDVQNS